MLIVRALVLSLVLAFPFGSSALENGAKHKLKEPEQAKSESNNNKTPSLPLVSVTVSPTVSATQQAAEKHGDEKHGAFPWESVTAISTFALAVITLVLAYLTLKLWREAVNAGGSAKSAAQAAQATTALALKEFATAHRPRLTIRTLVASEVVRNGSGRVTIEYDIVNSGDSTARVIKISERVWFPGNQNLPPMPPYAPPEIVNMEVKPGRITRTHTDSDVETFKEFAFNTGFVKGTHDATDRFRKASTMLFLGYIEYVDDSGANRRTAFLRECDFTTQRFNPHPHPEYEYQD